MLDEETKITLRSGATVISFLVAMVMGYFYTVETVNKSIEETNNRVLVLEQAQESSAKYREEDAKRLDEFNDNQIKMMIALGIQPAAQRK